MPLSQDQVHQLLIEWRDEISPSLESIRRSQDILLLKVGPEYALYALTMMTTMLGKGGNLVSNVNTTTIGNAGVAITGGNITGDVTGTAQNNNAAMQGDALQGLSKLKQAFLEAPELTSDQQQDASCAVEDLEAEAKKPESERSGSRVRNALNNISTALSLAKGAQFAYEHVLPHLQSLFHLAS